MHECQSLVQRFTQQRRFKLSMNRIIERNQFVIRKQRASRVVVVIPPSDRTNCYSTNKHRRFLFQTTLPKLKRSNHFNKYLKIGTHLSRKRQFDTNQ